MLITEKQKSFTIDRCILCFLLLTLETLVYLIREYVALVTIVVKCNELEFKRKNKVLILSFFKYTINVPSPTE